MRRLFIVGFADFRWGRPLGGGGDKLIRAELGHAAGIQSPWLSNEPAPTMNNAEQGCIVQYGLDGKLQAQ